VREWFLKKIIVVTLLCVASFFVGAVWGKLNFITSTAFTLDAPLMISSKIGNGVLPKGNELYFHSSAHSQTTYFASISVPEEIAKQYIRETSFDDYNSIKRLNATWGNTND
jgi:hypothetical protein